MGRSRRRHFRHASPGRPWWVSFASQLVGTLVGCGFALISGFIVYGGLKAIMGIRMSEEEEQAGADLSIHKIAARPEAGITR